VPPARVWLDPHAGWQDALYERLLEQRIVLASGVLDDAAATRLSAQLLTLDAEGTGPIRLELQNLQAELPAALTVMGVLDVIRAEIQAFASGETGGAALGVRRMVDSLFYRIAEAAGRDAGEIREDARRGRTFTAAEAIGYGLIQDRATKRPA
jgi:ATP-dependent Clp protease protease subunit